MAVGLFPGLGIVILVIVFCGVEEARGLELGDDFEPPLFEQCDELFGCLLLRFCQIKDRRAVLLSDVGSLPIFLGWIVDFKEGTSEGLVGGLVGIEEDFDGFGMTGVAGADLFVGGLSHCSADIARGDSDYPGDLLQVMLDAPETAAGKEGALVALVCHGRNKPDREGIDAVAGVLGGEALSEKQMPEMAVATMAENLGALSIGIGNLKHRFRDRRVKARPTTAAAKLV